MKYLLLLLFICFPFASCNKDAVNYQLGKWKWTETNGGISGGVVAVPSTGSVISMDINKNLTYRVHINNKAVDSGSYILNLIQNNDSVIRFDKTIAVKNLVLNDTKYYHEENNMLILTDFNIMDGYTSVFQKLR